MLGQDIVNEINRKLNGEFEAVTYLSDDWNTIVSVANENIDLYNKSADWRTSYNPMYNIGTVGDSEFYTMKNSEIAAISGSNRAFVLFYDSNNDIVDRYKLVAQDIFDRSGDSDKVVTINRNGLQIKPKTSTDIVYDCSIILPVFMNVPRILRATSSIVMDDIYWLIDRSAADLAATSPVDFISRNFDTYEQQASVRMKAMKKANRITQSSTPAIGHWNPITGMNG